MKKLFSFFLTLVASLGTMFAWDFTNVRIGDLYYNLDAINQTAAVQKGNYNGLTDVNIPSTVTHQGIVYNVVKISKYAFEYNSTITTVTIPNSISNIELGIFNGSTPVTTVNVAEDNPYYTSEGGVLFDKNKTELIYYPRKRVAGTYTIPNTVENINTESVFSNDYIKTIIIPESVRIVGSWAFTYCPNLETIIVSTNNPNFCSVDGALYSKDTATLYHYPEGIQTQKIILPVNTRTIDGHAFLHCVNIESVVIPDSVTDINNLAFRDCANLTSVVFGENVTNVASDAFTGCNLSTITWNARNCCDFSLNKTPFHNYSCDYRSQINTFVFGENVEHIPAYLCENMSLLSTITIPSSVSSIGNNAFQDCRGLIEIYNFATTPQAISSNVFENVNKSIPLYVPSIATMIYSQAPIWQDFLLIQPIKAIVKFIDWNGTVLKTDTVELEASATPPTSPSREGYTFIGWDEDFTHVTEDLVVTAQYEQGEPINYYVSFKDNEGAEIFNDAVIIRIPAAPEITGFTFLYWQTRTKNISDGVIEIQAIYEADEPTSAPAVYTNPANPAQKLIRDGNVYILTGNKTYTITGAEVK